MPYKCPIQEKEYQKKYRSDPDNFIVSQKYQKQWKLDRPLYHKQWIIDNEDEKSNYIYKIWGKFGLTKEMFIKLYEKQGGLCLGCDIKLVSNIFKKERKQFEDDPNLIEHVDYAIANVDHDHSFDIDGKHSGNPDSVRGLLCASCNCKDVLNPESKLYIYGDDPTVRETLLKNREVNVILKQWHKEENT